LGEDGNGSRHSPTGEWRDKLPGTTAAKVGRTLLLCSLHSLLANGSNPPHGPWRKCLTSTDESAGRVVTWIGLTGRFSGGCEGTIGSIGAGAWVDGHGGHGQVRQTACPPSLLHHCSAVAPFHGPRIQSLGKDVDRPQPSVVEMAPRVMALGQTGRHHCMTRKHVDGISPEGCSLCPVGKGGRGGSDSTDGAQTSGLGASGWGRSGGRGGP